MTRAMLRNLFTAEGTGVAAAHATDVAAQPAAAATRPAPGITAARVTLDTGVTLEYAERGPRDAAAVILLHGVTDSWRSFEPLMAHLPADLRVLAMTQRGHGGSSRPDDYRYAALAADVAGFMDALGVRRAVIAGHSMGSLVALRFAIDHPDGSGRAECSNNLRVTSGIRQGRLSVLG